MRNCGRTAQNRPTDDPINIVSLDRPHSLLVIWVAPRAQTHIHTLTRVQISANVCARYADILGGIMFALLAIALPTPPIIVGRTTCTEYWLRWACVGSVWASAELCKESCRSVFGGVLLWRPIFGAAKVPLAFVRQCVSARDYKRAAEEMLQPTLPTGRNFPVHSSLRGRVVRVMHHSGWIKCGSRYNGYLTWAWITAALSE